ncbi:hypothetical protein FHS99_000255 [Sphingomonas prati]|uniref:Uncharacterized protein n=1 Tax=Sphingomonas prati TaxID=1843237 RepID=A0A7W9BPN2_9SPHN|nr:hypothetical protein [Sphingomonas prati]
MIERLRLGYRIFCTLAGARNAPTPQVVPIRK